MTPEIVVRMFAEQGRLRVFAAVLLGADTLAKVVEVSGLSTKDAAIALRRLEDVDLVRSEGESLHARDEYFQELARRTTVPVPVENHGTGDDQTESLLRTFVCGERLLNVPAQLGRRRVVLQHVVRRVFEPEAKYDERAVNQKLREWCDGGKVDHVTIRRYLIDMGFLVRENGLYWLGAQA